MFGAACLSLLLNVSVPGPSVAHEDARGTVVYKALRYFGGDFTLTDHRGERFALESARGKVVLLFFSYTACVETCLVIIAKVGSVMDQLGPLSGQVQPLFLTVDPRRDTPDVLREYLRHFHPSIVGLTGTEEEIKRVTHQYRASAYTHKPDDHGAYNVDHSSFLFVLNRDGKLVNLIRYETKPSKVTDILRRLLEK